MSATIEIRRDGDWRTDGIGHGERGESHLTYATSGDAEEGVRRLMALADFAGAELRVNDRGLPVSCENEHPALDADMVRAAREHEEHAAEAYMPNMEPVPSRYFEVEGAGVDRFVKVYTEEEAARAVCETQAVRTLDALEWIEPGVYRWEAGVLGGRVTVREVSAEQSAALDGLDLDTGVPIEAAEYRVRA
jgi:hypothetical protein